MRPEELKEIVRELISRARTEEGIDKIIEWAQENHQEQLKNEISILKGRLTDLNRDKRLGLLASSEVSIQQNKISYSVLEFLDNVDGNNPVQNNTTDPLA